MSQELQQCFFETLFVNNYEPITKYIRKNLTKIKILHYSKLKIKLRLFTNYVMSYCAACICMLQWVNFFLTHLSIISLSLQNSLFYVAFMYFWESIIWQAHLQENGKKIVFVEVFFANEIFDEIFNILHNLCSNPHFWNLFSSDFNIIQLAFVSFKIRVFSTIDRKNAQKSIYCSMKILYLCRLFSIQSQTNSYCKRNMKAIISLYLNILLCFLH